jgi:hypothetical protein
MKHRNNKQHDKDNCRQSLADFSHRPSLPGIILMEGGYGNIILSGIWNMHYPVWHRLMDILLLMKIGK